MTDRDGPGQVELHTHTDVPAALLPALWDVYTRSFGPLAYIAASRHVMPKETFLVEMADPAITKLIVTDAGRPVSMVTLTWDLELVSWVSPEFYRSRYPEQSAAGRLFFITNMLTDPDYHGHEPFLLLSAEMYRLGKGGVIGSDSCASVVTRGFVEAMRKRMLDLHDGKGTVEAVDTQTFFAFDLT